MRVTILKANVPSPYGINYAVGSIQTVDDSYGTSLVMSGSAADTDRVLTGPPNDPFSRGAVFNTPSYLANTYNATKLGNTVVLFGDSLTDFNNYQGGVSSAVTNNYGNKGFMSWANYLLEQRLNIVAIKGNGGNTTQQMLDRIYTDVIPFQPWGCVVLGGINDVAQGIPTATTLANLRRIYAILLQYGIVPIACTVWPINAGLSWDANKLGIFRINAGIAETCYTTKGIIYVDTCDGIINPLSTSGYAATGMLNVDNLHPEGTAAYYAGYKVYEALLPHLPAIPRLTGSYADSMAVDGSSLQLADNPTFVGSAGTTTPGGGAISGTVASLWNVQVASGAASVVCSVVAGPNGNIQRLVITNASGTSAVFLQAVNQNASRYNPGDRIYSTVKTSLTNPVNMDRFHLQLGAQALALSSYGRGPDSIILPNVNMTGVDKSGIITIPASPSGAGPIMVIRFTGAGGATLDISNFDIQKLPV